MLKKEYLRELATKKQISFDNILREYAQNVFLSLLYKEKAGKKMLFKGGTALRLAFGSPRFSEDLDFTLKNISFNQVESTVLAVLNNLEKEGFEPKIAESKKTSGGYLAKLIAAIDGEKVEISIQGSQRKKGQAKPEVKLIINDFIPNYSAYLLEEKGLIGEKISAALTRSKPRDFFDVYYLLRGGHIPVELREKLLKIPNIVENKELNFQKDLAYLLPQSMQDLVKTFPEPLLREIGKLQ